jgi:hypothetical protein
MAWWVSRTVTWGDLALGDGGRVAGTVVSGLSLLRRIGLAAPRAVWAWIAQAYMCASYLLQAEAQDPVLRDYLEMYMLGRLGCLYMLAVGSILAGSVVLEAGARDFPAQAGPLSLRQPMRKYYRAL